MATTSVGAVEAELVKYERALDAVNQQVTADVTALDLAGRTAADCAARVKGTSQEMTSARTVLRAGWAAPSGAAFQTATEPLPEGIAATERLFAGLGTGLRELAWVLNQTQDRVGTFRNQFSDWASDVRALLSQSTPIPDEWRQEAIRVGGSYLDAATRSAQELDTALDQFTAAITQLADRLAAAGTVKP
jgi:uncharacterized protein YukE